MAKRFEQVSANGSSQITEIGDDGSIKVTQNPPTKFNIASTSTSNTSSIIYDSTTTHNGQVVAHEHNETPPTTVSGDAAQATDQQG